MRIDALLIVTLMITYPWWTVVQISYFGRFQQSTPGCGVVTGRVVDQTNRPVAGVKVYSVIMDRPPRGRVLYTISDSKGEFTLSCAEVGRNAIYATNEDEGYPDTLMTPFIDAKSFPVVDVKPEATGSVEVVLPPKSGRLVARVVDAKSKKVIDGATVTLCRAEAPSDCRSLRATQRVDGNSSLIPPIPFTIKASAKAYTDKVLLDDKGRPAVIRISPETTRTVEIKLKTNVH